MFLVMFALAFGLVFLLDILLIIGATDPTLFVIVEICIFSYAYFMAFNVPKERMLQTKEIVKVGAFALVFVGVLLIIMAIFVLIKFLVTKMLQQIVLLYLIGLHGPLGIALAFSSAAYYKYGEHYMSTSGKILAFSAVLAGLGYTLEGFGMIMWDIFMLGIGITLTRIGITFYVILSIWFYSEIEGSRLGSIGSALLVIFAWVEFDDVE